MLPLVSVAVQPFPPAVESSSVRGAQARLAELVGEADAVHSLSVRRTSSKPSALDISLDHGGAAYRVTAYIDARGEVTRLVFAERRSFGELADLGSLSWLSPVIANATAITRITVDEDDAITLTTDAGERYMIIPGRGSGGGNEATSARWAAAWDTPDG